MRGFTDARYEIFENGLNDRLHRANRLSYARKPQQSGPEPVSTGLGILLDKAVFFERDEEASCRRLVESGQSCDLTESDRGPSFRKEPQQSECFVYCLHRPFAYCQCDANLRGDILDPAWHICKHYLNQWFTI